MESEHIVGQEYAVKILSSMIKNKRFQNIIIDGPISVGKSMFIREIIKDLFTERYQRENNILYLSIRKERNIKNIRCLLKKFSVSSVNENDLKLIIIDNFELLTNEVQYSLRRIIEIYSKKIRFIFTCSTYFKIIYPIVSRCILLFFGNLSLGDKRTILFNKKISSIDDSEFDEIIKKKNISYILNNLEDVENKKIHVEKNDFCRLFQDISDKEISLYEFSKGLKERCCDYEDFIQDFIMFVINDEKMSHVQKFEIVKQSTSLYSNIANKGNPVLNIVAILNMYLSNNH